MEHIAGLPDKDLLRMVYFDHAQYQSEAITYAKAEIAKRRVNITQVDLSNPSDTAISHPFIIGIQKTRQFSVMIIRTRAYALGFLAGGFVFALFNILSHRRMIKEAGCCDLFMSFGFPLDWYTYGGYSGTTHIHWWKIVANIIAGIFMCLLSGWLFRSMVEKIRSYVEAA